MSQERGTGLDIGVGAMSRAAGRGNTRASFHNFLKGKNWSGSKPFIEQPKDRTGVIFCARTDMQLSRGNLKGHRQFEPLISSSHLSMGRALAAILDPRASRDGKASPLMDPYYGFNPIMDNSVVSCTGWPNNVVNVTPTPPNEKGGSTLLIEGKFKNGKEFDLTIEHVNTEGDIVSQMYAVMTRYPTLIRQREMDMYMDNIILDRADYKQRIYRFVFDKTGHSVEQFTMTGEAFPVSDSTGNAMNYTSDSALNEGYDTISAQWKCGGYYHMDPIVIDEFNRTQIMHNPAMVDGIREETYYRIGSDEGVPSLALADLYSYIGYPRIHPLTLEFEIWVPKPIYNILKNYSNTDEFKEAMIAKNDADLYYGTSEWDQDAFRDAMGWDFTDLINTAGGAGIIDNGEQTA